MTPKVYPRPLVGRGSGLEAARCPAQGEEADPEDQAHAADDDPERWPTRGRGETARALRGRLAGIEVRGVPVGVVAAREDLAVLAVGRVGLRHGRLAAT